MRKKLDIRINNISAPVISGSVLNENEIAVWRCDISQLSGDIAGKMHLLTPDETERCGRYLREADRVRFAGGRIYTRIIAGMYLSVSPENIIIRTDENQKPFIESPGRKLYHNISHSGNYILFAFSYNTEVGIDVEKITDKNDIDSLCRVFHPKERDIITGTRNNKLFYRYWTAKEAYVKAVGRGLLIDFSDFYISEDDIVYSSNGAATDYRIVRLSDSDNYAEALSYK